MYQCLWSGSRPKEPRMSIACVTNSNHVQSLTSSPVNSHQHIFIFSRRSHRFVFPLPWCTLRTYACSLSQLRYQLVRLEMHTDTDYLPGKAWPKELASLVSTPAEPSLSSFANKSGTWTVGEADRLDPWRDGCWATSFFFSPRPTSRPEGNVLLGISSKDSHALSIIG